MKNCISHSGWIEKGNLKLSNKKRFEQEIKSFPDSDVKVIVKKAGKRSTQQNRYYRGVVVELIREELERRGFRYDGDTIHEYLKQRFNSEKAVLKDTGEVLEIGQTTTDFNKDEMSDYVTRIKEWAAVSLEIYIPEPSEQTDLKFK